MMRPAMVLVLFGWSLFALGCSREISDGGTRISTAASNDASATSGGSVETEVLDFTSSVQHRVPFGGGFSAAFTIDPSQPVRNYPFPDNQHIVGPGFNSSYDLATCPSDPNSWTVAQHVAALETGTEAEVVSVDLESDSPAESPVSTVCFGYRHQGQWHYDSMKTLVTYDSAAQRSRAHVPINKGLADGIFLSTNAGGLYLLRITITVAP